MTPEIDILRELGVDIRCGVEVGKDVTLAELRRQGYRAFYIAIGCQGGRRAGVPARTPRALRPPSTCCASSAVTRAAK